MSALPEGVKVYTVNGAAAGSSTSLPDWLTRKRAAKGGKGKRAVVKEQIEGTIDLIQHFEFPEASNRIKTTRDGHHAVATGTYKPQMRVYDLDELTLKFERHSDSENVDFVILSDDWTKVMQLQSDRSVELHTQGGLHYKTRIPRFGRALNYHYPSCDALISATGHEVYRLSLDQGRFLNPIALDADAVQGVNCIDVNPAHQLLALGTEAYSGDASGATVEFWDPRSRTRLSALRIPWSQLTTPGRETSQEMLAITAIASRSDGLSLAVGTSTGHTLLYDIRSPRAYATKDQGYGLPIKHVSWAEGGQKVAGEGIVISADKKVVKLWDRNTSSVNFASITPTNDINDVHHIPGSGMIMMANEGIQMTSYYIPQLGPAPRWCTFLDNITEEMEDQNVRNVYDDFKFVERSEISTLGLDHLVGTPTLKPYMHGYFMSLKLYDAARVIANPFAYAEYREKVVQDKLSKLADSRIRARNGALPKVNKALAEKIIRNEEREERKRAKRPSAAGNESAEPEKTTKKDKSGTANVLSDPRFKELFENPEYQVDETSREYALLNPASVDPSAKKRKTAVEEEEEESDLPSSDGLGESTSESEGDNSFADSSDDGELVKFNPRARDPQPSLRRKAVSEARNPFSKHALTSVRPTLSTANGGSASNRGRDRDAAFGERKHGKEGTYLSGHTGAKGKGKAASGDRATFLPGGAAEISWVPSKSGTGDDSLFDDGRGLEQGSKRKAGDSGNGKVESFGAGMEKGRIPKDADNGRAGRTKRRTNVRSGSRNTFRQM